MVRERGLEPPPLAGPDPKSGVSAISPLAQPDCRPILMPPRCHAAPEPRQIKSAGKPSRRCWNRASGQSMQSGARAAKPSGETANYAANSLLRRISEFPGLDCDARDCFPRGRPIGRDRYCNRQALESRPRAAGLNRAVVGGPENSYFCRSQAFSLPL
jgi:hypothetical protein